MRVRLVLIFVFFLLLSSYIVHGQTVADYSVQGCDSCARTSGEYTVRVGSTTVRGWTAASTPSNSNCGSRTISHNGIGTVSSPPDYICAVQGQVQFRLRFAVVGGSATGVNQGGACNTAAHFTSGLEDDSGTTTAWTNAYVINWDTNSGHCTCSGRTWISGTGGSGAGCCGDEYSTHSGNWLTTSVANGACCNEVHITDRQFCSAESRWVIETSWCNNPVRQDSKFSGDLDAENSDLQCNCDSSGVICGTTGSQNANGVCASGVCVTGVVCRTSGSGNDFQNGCSSCSYGAQCDSNVNSGGATPTYIADGVCGGSSHGTCYTQWAADATTSITASSVFGTADSNVCTGNGGWYCNNVGDGVFSPGTNTCLHSGSCISASSQNTNQECAITLQCVTDHTCVGGPSGQCLRNDGQSCDSGSQCINDCVEGTCRTAGSSYNGDRCSGGTSTNNWNSYGIIVATNSGRTAWTCDNSHASLSDSWYYASCSLTGFGVECDSDSLAGGYSVDGVCGGSSHGTCYTQWAADQTPSVTASSVFGTESFVCTGRNTWQCDDIGDGSFSPGNKRCDASNNACVVCDFTTNRKTGNICESGCGATSNCDDWDPFQTVAGVGWCHGEHGCQQFCDSYIRDGSGGVSENSGLDNGDFCGGCSAATTGHRCDSNTDGNWNGVCADRGGGNWDCVTEDVALDESVTQHRDGCEQVVDDSPCSPTIGSGGFLGEGFCSFENDCCLDMRVELPDDQIACVCRQQYNGFRCDSDGSGGEEGWDGVCAQTYSGSWECATDFVYFDGTNYRSGTYSPTYDGYMCDANVGNPGFVQKGLTTASVTCIAFPPNPVSCEFGAGSACFDQCSNTGHQCTTSTLVNPFTKTGLCTWDSTACIETGHVCYDGSRYRDDCSKCYRDQLQSTTGDVCHSEPWTGGNFNADGICTNQGCAVQEEVCVDSDENFFKSGCSNCAGGSICNTGASLGTSFSVEGFCVQDSCYVPDSISNPYVDANENELFDDDGIDARTCHANTRHHLCAINVDGVTFNSDRTWHGLCIEYDGTGWECDTSLVTCRFDKETRFDRDSVCIDSFLDDTISTSSTFQDSFSASSTISGNSFIDSSEVRNSNVEDSTITNSVLYDSNVVGSSITDSTVINTEICSGIVATNVRIANDVLISGALRIDGRWYTAPSRISVICSDGIPDPTGYLMFNKSVVSDGDDIEIRYISSEQNYLVTVNLEIIGGPSDLPLVHQGEGIYIATFDNIDYNNANGYVDIVASVTSPSDAWNVKGILLFDNQPPSASIKIYSLLGDDEKTGSPTVILETSYSDSIGIDGCRYANDDPNFSGEFVRCKPSLFWSLSLDEGPKTVHMQVRNLAGKTVEVSDTIFFNRSWTGDTTPPTPPVVLASSNYTNSPDTLSFRWFNSTDIEQSLLFNPIYYDLWLCENSDCTYMNYTTDTEITFTGLNLVEEAAYTLLVSAFNVEFLYSRNVSSRPTIYPDFTPPENTTITPGTGLDLEGWNDGNNISFLLTAPPDFSGIASFSTSLSRNPNVNPDSIGNSNGTISFNALPDGRYYFKARAIDGAGNVGPISNITFNVDSTPPTVPQMLNFRQNTSNSSILVYNWTSSYDISGIVDYHLQIARDINFDNLVFNASLGVTNSYSFFAAEDGVYFARVRARNGAGLYSFFSDRLVGRIDLTPPEIIFKKPSSTGRAISREPTLVVRTNKVAFCTYAQESGIGGDFEMMFDVTYLRTHESRIFLSEDGEYTYNIVCVDLVGNYVTDSISFIVDTTRTPSNLDIDETIDTIYSGQISVINFTVSDSTYGLGEIPPQDFRVYFDGGLASLIDGDYSISDMGAGNYQVAFVTEKMGNLDLRLYYKESGVTDSRRFNVRRLNIDTGCDPDVDDFCDIMRIGQTISRRAQENYRIIIQRDDFESFYRINRCPQSEDRISSGDCLRVENIGNGNVCLAFSRDCGPDTVTVIIDE